MKSDSSKVLIIALAANVGIAAAKFVAAAVTGSSAMLTEGVHSLVDSTNQLLLMYGQKRAAKAADAAHPAGYGRELYFWSFVVALLVFALGAGVSIYEGIVHILGPEPAVAPLVAYGVLALAFALEGGSTWAAFREFDAARRGKSWWRALTSTKDSATVIVLLENGAAMLGVVIAAIGLAVSQLTGDPRFDGAASILIGLLLGLVAIFLAREAKGLLIGEAADPELVAGIRRAVARDGVMGIGEIMTIHNAPELGRALERRLLYRGRGQGRTFETIGIIPMMGPWLDDAVSRGSRFSSRSARSRLMMLEWTAPNGIAVCQGEVFEALT